MLIRSIERVDVKGEERWYVQMSYDPEFINRLKASIPFPKRGYDPDRKQWHFSKEGLDMFRAMPGIKFYEEALAEVVDTSDLMVPEPWRGIDTSIDFQRFDRPATKYADPLSLWNFQKEGVSRLVHTESNGLSFSMGLGKTYTTICAAKELMDRGIIKRCLVISIVSIALDSWVTTLDRMGYSYELLLGPLKLRPSAFKTSDVEFILTLDTSCDDKKYPLFTTRESLLDKKGVPSKKNKSFVDVCAEQEDLMVVVDEIHKLSNTQSKTFKNMLKIRKKSRRAVLLTGTLMKSTPEKVLLPLRFAYPAIFSNKAEFENAFTIKDFDRFGPTIVGYRNLDILKEILHRVAMPALKKDHLKELPGQLPPVEITCETDKVSLELIDLMRNEAATIAQPGRRSNLLELKDFYIRVHQALVCPSAFRKGIRAENRLQAVFDCLENMEGKTVIFTTLKRAIHELYEYLTSMGIKCTSCSGDQDYDEIQRRVDKFVEDDECTVCICTIQKMGTGFDRLKVAQNAIVYDLNTNGGDFKQAIDRLDRAGQTHKVSVVYILQDNAISEYQYEKLMMQVKMMDEIEDEHLPEMESAIDFRYILELLKDSNQFMRRKKKR